MYNIYEKCITKTWDLERYDKPLITIRCMAYNHEQYISEAIEGILKQKTSFPFVIFIHDDCSTDNTTNIIKEYKNKYPNIINSVFEEENQWSKNDESLSQIIRENIHTKYVAICEGDDYWIDENKLEKQILYLEKHPEFSLSITNGRVFDVKNDKYESIFMDEKEKEFGSSNQIISLANCASLMFPPTASYVYKYDFGREFENVPSCFNGDMRLRLYYMTRGNCYYLKDDTVVYRKNVTGSAMTMAKKKNRNEIFEQELQTCQMIDYIDSLSKYLYSEELWKVKSKRVQACISNSRSLKILFNPYYKRAWKEWSMVKKITVVIKILMPDFVYEKLRK